MKYRKDFRTKEQFEQDLKKYHKIEQIWSQILDFDLNQKGFQTNIIPY
jgi:hypothetical protein